MSPSIFEFAIDFNLLIEVLITIVVMSFFIERALSVVFGSELFLKWYDPCFKAKRAREMEECLKQGDQEEEAPDAPLDTEADPENTNKEEPNYGVKKSGAKEIISVIVSISAVVFWDFDAVTIIFKTYNEPQLFGFFVTGMIVAGGTKASIKLFQDVLGFRTSAESARKPKPNN